MTNHPLHRAALPFTLLFLVAASLARAADPPGVEPGPENGGLRMRLVVVPRSGAPTEERYDVRVDLLNISARPIVLRAAWDHQTDEGDLAAYLIAAASIETDPPIAPWVGQVMQGHRESPQPQRTLAAGDSLALVWRTEGRRLKNAVTDPNAVQNPQFPVPGLYAVHATLIVPTPDGPVRLRSNEQLVSVGGSAKAPRHTFGRLLNVDADAKTATLSLGALHGVRVGDQFGVRSNFRDEWTLTVTHVSQEISTGTLTPDPPRAELSSNRPPALPERHTTATLIPAK
jgi:hypothetical protein